MEGKVGSGPVRRDHTQQEMRVCSTELAKGSNIYSAPTVYQMLYTLDYFILTGACKAQTIIPILEVMKWEFRDTCPTGFEPWVVWLQPPAPSTVPAASWRAEEWNLSPML